MVVVDHNLMVQAVVELQQMVKVMQVALLRACAARRPALAQ